MEVEIGDVVSKGKRIGVVVKKEDGSLAIRLVYNMIRHQIYRTEPERIVPVTLEYI